MSTEEHNCSTQEHMEMFQRALGQNDPLAWEFLQRRFSGMMRSWLRRHPQRDIAYRYESEENYIALGFERFWYATTCKGHVQFDTLASALDYLRLSLNSAVLDTLRTYARSDALSLPGPGNPNVPWEENHQDTHEIWEVIQSLLPDEHERRVAYLLYYCGLKPRQIVRFCQQEFSDVQEIYRVRRRIVERLERNANTLCWRLQDSEKRVETDLV
jgi:hypothetical protein